LNRKDFIKYLSFSAGGIILFNEETYGERTPKSPGFIPQPEIWKDNELNIAWIGHATVLINLYGTLILTDPALLARVGVEFMGLTYGPTRYIYPALDIDVIPCPDIILISHAHMDHMDYGTLKFLTRKYANRINCITASNTGDIIDDLKWKSLSELDWKEKLQIADTEFTGVQVKHNGWRYPFEMDRQDNPKGRSYNGYTIEKQGVKIFFAGDTGFTDKLKSLKENNIVIAIFPIGGYVPKKQYHCNPEEALIMAVDYIGANYFIPVHCKTFDTDDELEKPLIWLEKIRHDFNIKIALNDIGQTFKY
jgi:L-ascorbate metabolism protein UlaG (beta-lactamase superfamily)